MKHPAIKKLFVIVISVLCVLSAHLHAQENEPVPAGDYTIDMSHTSLLFRVNHLGFSMYTARFNGIQAKLSFDPQAPTNAKLDVTIDVASIETDFPMLEIVDFDKELSGKNWLDAETWPTMHYRSQSVTQRSDGRLIINGELTLHGITKPVVLVASYNGGYAGHPMDKNARIGFSATGKLNRSDFGIGFGIPAEGSTMGVSDAVEIIIETEFSGPEWQG